MRKILLHACCAPCAAAAAGILKESFSTTAYFFNPNIHPENEHFLRLEECRRYMLMEGAEVLEGRYEPREWFKAVKGLEAEKEGGARCAACFRIRLDETARKAAEEGYGHIATTLSAGPRKNADLINKIGSESASAHNVKFAAADFKKRGGFTKSLEACRKHGIYRQNYCGCVFSKKCAE